MRIRLEKEVVIELYRRCFEWRRVIHAPLPAGQDAVLGKEWDFVRNYYDRARAEELRGLVCELGRRMADRTVSAQEGRKALEGLDKWYHDNPVRVYFGPWLARWRGSFTLGNELAFILDRLQCLLVVLESEARPERWAIIRLRMDLSLAEWALERRCPGLKKIAGPMNPYPWEETVRKRAG